MKSRMGSVEDQFMDYRVREQFWDSVWDRVRDQDEEER